MTKNVQEALSNVDMVYSDLVEIANDMLAQATGDIAVVIEPVYENVEKLTNDDLKNIILKLAVRSFSFSEIKEKAAFKANIAETLRKEKYAANFGLAEGSVAAKENLATVQTSAEILAEEIYDLVADLFKVKLDEVHRVIDSLKTVLTSRLAEAKLSSAINSTTEF